ncbi:hypothetical protein Tel_10540 [Candidatus Tenderia electrophaga]|jgi:hypothetical protein|uniref:DUF3943 domain-containing protein n=1 Tax=Candidatus Tenderia electrophaga TaxID=1748243 RepID=A0A0S2TEH7_9GAMM|nr:hypothetical protein Tel_10540 [Candidatus Tenderia electrophaga]
MTVKKLLGWLLALIPIPALCLDTALTGAQLDLRPQLGLGDAHLHIAAAATQDSEIAPATAQSADNAEFPHLEIPAEPDWDGITSDTKLFLLYQVAVVGVLYLMPESVSQWDDEDKSGNIFGKWDNNVNSLRKDSDDWAINFIGHPYFGAVYYVRARHRGFDRQASFWYGLIMSTIYEYGIEALFEPVSIQDMIFTPVGGAVMGEYFMIGHENIKRGIAARGYARTRDKVGLFFTDPLGAINDKVNQWFGTSDEQAARLELYPMLSARDDTLSSLEVRGVQAFYRW